MSDPCCKVAAVGRRYDLHTEVIPDTLDEYLIARWKGLNDYPETGTRPLAGWFNRTVLEVVYSAHDRRATETQIGSDYEALTDDDTLVRGAILDDLEEDGIDGEQLVDDFVSSATMYRHLTDHLGAEKPKKEGSDWEGRKIEYGKDVVRRNVEDALQSLENKSRLPRATDAELDVRVMLGCPDCSTKVRYERAIKRGYICRDHMDG